MSNGSYDEMKQEVGSCLNFLTVVLQTVDEFSYWWSKVKIWP